MLAPEMVLFLGNRRFHLSDEKRLQSLIAAEFVTAGIEHEREVRLSGADIIDFMVGDIGIEVKIKGQRREIYRQCERYCRHEKVKALILATNVAMGFPPELAGKATYFVHLGRAWL
jgi:hypothetical protein